MEFFTDDEADRGMAPGVDTVVFDGITSECAENLKGKLNFVHFNVRSVGRNFDELIVYLHQLNIDSVQVIILSECWNLKGVSKTEFYIPEFRAYNNDSHFNQNDGCIVYIRESIEAMINIIPLSNINLLRVTFFYNDNSIGLTASYRPNPTNIRQYIGELDGYFANIARKSIELFIGDINIDLLKISDTQVSNYVNTLAEHGLFSYIDKPTRITESSQSLIDHIFVGMNNKVRKDLLIKSCICRISLTDHDMVCLSIAPRGKHTKSEVNKRDPYHKVINLDKVRNDLVGEQWIGVFDSDCVHSAGEAFYSILNKHIINNTTFRKISNKKFKIKSWMSEAILNSIRRRDRLKKSLLRNSTAELRVYYTTYRNKLNKIIKCAKNYHYKNRITDANNNYKKIWSILNQVTNSRPKKKYTSKCKHSRG